MGRFDPEFVDFAAYADAVYTPPPALVKLAADDPFWLTLGGSATDPFGCGGETFRQREAARALRSQSALPTAPASDPGAAPAPPACPKPRGRGLSS